MTMPYAGVDAPKPPSKQPSQSLMSLEQLDSTIGLVGNELDRLVRVLSAVLPEGYDGQKTPAHPTPEPTGSPLAQRLEVLGRRAHLLVLQLQDLTEAVDL